MGTFMRSALLVGASALLVATLAPMAVAGSSKPDDSIWQDSDRKVSHGSRAGQDKGRFQRGPRGEKNPMGETPVAPVPEPGTMALMSLGLVSLAAAMRKRRAGSRVDNGTAE
jgi:hypothetical protein